MEWFFDRRSCVTCDGGVRQKIRGGQNMLVPDFVRQCVLFLGIKDTETSRFIPKATAFVVSIFEQGCGFRYIVTAKHNVENFTKFGLTMFIRSNLRNGGVREDDWSAARWYFHPDLASTDVAVATITFDTAEEYRTIVLRTDAPNKGTVATTEVMEANNIGLGDEVFIVGLFKSHHGQKMNVPIVRIGNLAMMKGEPVWTTYCGYTEAHLVEARSIDGLSGSPVFIHSPVLHPQGATQFRLLGLMHGHFDIKNLNEDIVVEHLADVTRGINTGIGVVIPVEKILETIDQPELAEQRKKLADDNRKRYPNADVTRDQPQ
jgi:hypothetical protein